VATTDFRKIDKMKISFRIALLCLLPSQSICFQSQQLLLLHRQTNVRVAKCCREMVNNDGEGDSLPGNSNGDNNNPGSRARRNILRISAGLLLASPPLPSVAGEVGARITKAVTTSDLGISVRTSVVKGAQVMDQLDGKWEKFSDKFGLGAERSKQGSRPNPKVIPDPLPLDIGVAQKVLELSDNAFCSQTGVQPSVLAEQIQKVASLAKSSFERSGLAVNADNPLKFETGPQFNFVTYAHFKAYSDLILEQKIVSFASFRSRFEAQVGQQLVSLLVPAGYVVVVVKPQSPENNSSEEVKKASLENALKAIDELGKVLVDKGLVALVERSSVTDDQIYDWIDDTSDLEFTVASDLDTTLNAQILLQEQGFRLYPNFARYAVKYLMNQVVAVDQKVSVLDYYFDTDYNSDPDKFEVKEILLSVILENP
jgi:hypothetical protein